MPKLKSKITVIIADDHLVVRMGLSAIISLEADMTVVGEADTGINAVKLARQKSPDVVVMDLMMPEMNGAEATAKIIKDNPKTKVIILTSYATASELKQAFSAGAVSALVKTSSQTEIIAAIRDTIKGRRIVSEEIERALYQAQSNLSLSPRQIEILKLVANGLTNQDIARILGIGIETVKDHLRTIFSNLGVVSRAEAVSLALNNKLFDK